MGFSGLHPGLTQETRIGPIAAEIYGIKGSVATYDLLPDATTLDENTIYVVRLDGTGGTAAPNGNGLYWTQSNAWAFLDALSLQDSGEVENKSGVTGSTVSNAVDELDSAKLPKTVEISAQNGTSYSLQASDNGRLVTLDNAGAITLTIPAGLGAGFSCTVLQKGAGTVSWSASGTTVNNRQGHTGTAGQYSAISVVAHAADTFIVQGDAA